MENQETILFIVISKVCISKWCNKSIGGMEYSR